MKNFSPLRTFLGDQDYAAFLKAVDEGDAETILRGMLKALCTMYSPLEPPKSKVIEIIEYINEGSLCTAHDLINCPECLAEAIADVDALYLKWRSS